MKRNIVIVAGGDSAEHDVSLRSAQGIYSFINKEQYDCYIVEITGQQWYAYLGNGEKSEVNHGNFSFMVDDKLVTPDFAYITIHGAPGENGVLQGYFDMLCIPYSTSGVLQEAITYNKFVLNNFLRSFGYNIAPSILLRKGYENKFNDQEIVEKVGLPCFIKPCCDGSSFGVKKIKTIEEIRPAIQEVMNGYSDVMIESFLQGTEITCGCYQTKNVQCTLPITEVVTHNEFFDYDAKYHGQVEEITPARIADSTAQRVSKLTKEIYELLDCKGIIRIDYILTGEVGNETINILEVNTTPGMTATSFIPQQVKAAGKNMGEVLSEIIEDNF